MFMTVCLFFRSDEYFGGFPRVTGPVGDEVDKRNEVFWSACRGRGVLCRNLRLSSPLIPGASWISSVFKTRPASSLIAR